MKRPTPEGPMARLLGASASAARLMAASVRLRVTVAAVLAVGAALGVSAGVINASLQHDRQRILMATAQEQARVVASYNRSLSASFYLPPDANIDTGLVQVVTRNGRVVAASRPLRHLPPLWAPEGPNPVQSAELLSNLGARDVQVVPVPVTIGSTKATVVVVTSLDQYDHTVDLVQRLLVVGMPLLLAVVGLICWFMAGRSLRPIELMRREVAEVVTIRGGHRVAEPANDDEVGRLARTLNSMLDRIEASSERERRFVSDASHELRSPIANIRTELEVALHHPGTAEWRQVAEEVLGQNERMERLVSGLLLLARSDEGSLLPAAVPIDLAVVVADSVAGPRGGPVIEIATAPAWVAVPRVYLERMVSNLVDNARRFASTRVSLSVALESDQAVLRVLDDGPGVPASERRRIFERFVRLDEARNRSEGGFGLGLAIVADLSRFYRGTIEVGEAGPGAEFVLRLPAVAAPVSREPISPLAG